MKKRICAVIVLLLTYTASFGADDNQSKAEDRQETAQVSVLSVTSNWGIIFFQTFISPIDDKRCIFSPTCSAYARQAIKKYGFIRAYPLITARLIRCNGSAYYSRHYDRAEEGKGGPCYDPVQ